MLYHKQIGGKCSQLFNGSYSLMWHACVPESTTYHQLRWKNSHIFMQFIYVVLITYIQSKCKNSQQLIPILYSLHLFILQSYEKREQKGEITRIRIDALFKNTRKISKAKASQIIGFLGQHLSQFRTMKLQQSMEFHSIKSFFTISTSR